MNISCDLARQRQRATWSCIMVQFTSYTPNTLVRFDSFDSHLKQYLKIFLAAMLTTDVIGVIKEDKGKLLLCMCY